MITASCFRGQSFNHMPCSKLCPHEKRVRNEKVQRSSWSKRIKAFTEDVLGKFALSVSDYTEQLLSAKRFHSLPVQYEAQAEHDIAKRNQTMVKHGTISSAAVQKQMPCHIIVSWSVAEIWLSNRLQRPLKYKNKMREGLISGKGSQPRFDGI